MILVIYSLPNKSTADNNFLTQPHSATKAKQLEAWRHLVLNYCQVESAAFKYSQEMKTKISRFIQYLSLIWLTLETCPCFTTQAYREDCQRRQYSQSLKILPSSEWILPQRSFYIRDSQWQLGVDRQEQTQRSHLLEVPCTARPRDIQVRTAPNIVRSAPNTF